MFILQIILLLLAGYLLFYSLFWLSLMIFSLREKADQGIQENPENPEILVILPAYRPGPIFKEVLDAIESARRGRDIQVYVLLQHAEPSYGHYAREKGFFVEEMIFDHIGGNSYQHALHYIVDVIERGQSQGQWHPEFVMIVDKDNLIDADFFNKIPAGMYDGFDVIQGRRLSMTTENAVSFFDSVSEKLNDHMFRSAKQQLGGMVEISGSGALIETDLFTDSIRKLDMEAPGFDKNFMVQMLTTEREVRTLFWKASRLTEEKTNSFDAHNPQRVRWFGEQYFNALFHAGSLFRAFRKYRRVAALDYLVTLWRPPRSVQILVTPSLALTEIFIRFYAGWWIGFVPIFTIAACILCVALGTFVISERIFLESLKYAVNVPALAFRNVISAIRSVRRENRAKFIHTKHER